MQEVPSPNSRSPKGMAFFTSTRCSPGMINPKKSGILNAKVTNTTLRKTNFEAHLSGTTLSKIKTMVIGYKNINPGTAIAMIKSTLKLPTTIPRSAPNAAVESYRPFLTL